MFYFSVSCKILHFYREIEHGSLRKKYHLCTRIQKNIRRYEIKIDDYAVDGRGATQQLW